MNVMDLIDTYARALANVDFFSGKVTSSVQLDKAYAARKDLLDALETPQMRMLASLRHAYAQLNLGVVKDQKQFADGLIAPAIRQLEKQMGLGIDERNNSNV